LSDAFSGTKAPLFAYQCLSRTAILNESGLSHVPPSFWLARSYELVLTNGDE
jgi:hypothetical protein